MLLRFILLLGFLASGVFIIHSFTGDLEKTIQLSTQFGIALGALGVGYLQISVNERLIRLQDYVAAAIVPGTSPNSVHFLNTGRINLYIHRIEVRDEEADILLQATDIFTHPRLLPVGTLDAGFYRFHLSQEAQKHKNIKLSLYVTDNLERKWLSQHAAEVFEEGKIDVWSYKTVRHEWSDEMKEEEEGAD